MQFSELLQQPRLSLQAAQSICRVHHLDSDCTRLEGGSQLVFSLSGQHVLKLFSPEDRSFCRNEEIFLRALQRQLPVQTPELRGSGEWEGLPYILMQKLDGIPLNRVWDRLRMDEREAIVRQLGELTRALHALPVGEFCASPWEWHSFIEEQRRNLAENHRSYGLEPELLAQLGEVVEGAAIDLHDPGCMGPLHTELMLEHVFVRQDGANWILSGLIDFEPSMVGHTEYEFCAVGIFITQGNPRLLRLFLSAYGYTTAALTPAFSRRMMALLLLHRYSNLRWFRNRAAGMAEMANLQQMEQYWFGLDG